MAFKPKINAGLFFYSPQFYNNWSVNFPQVSNILPLFMHETPIKPTKTRSESRKDTCWEE